MFYINRQINFLVYIHVLQIRLRILQAFICIFIRF